jgi:hypothetical protein
MLTELMGSKRNHVVKVKPLSYGHFANGGRTMACQLRKKNCFGKIGNLLGDKE